MSLFAMLEVKATCDESLVKGLLYGLSPSMTFTVSRPAGLKDKALRCYYDFIVAEQV